MYRPHVANLLMYVFRNMRHVDFRGLMGSQRDPRVMGRHTYIFLNFSCKTREIPIFGIRAKS